MTWWVAGSGRLLDPEPVATDGTPWAIEVDDQGRIGAVLIDGHPPSGARAVDVGDSLVTPGLIDAHTHLIYAGDRSDEVAARSSGTNYDGGGILRTVATTHAATDGELAASLRARIDDALAHGTTSLEVKSGYGLTTVDETRLLCIVNDVATAHVVDVVVTFLGAHAVPSGSSPSAATENVIATLQEVADLASFVDVFCEPHLFDVNLTERILIAASHAGFGTRLHADQLGRSGGARLAARLRVTSADHLEHASSGDIEQLARAGVVATVVPGPAVMLRSRKPDVRTMLEHGLPIALGSDANAGTFGNPDMTLAIGLAVGAFGMSVTDALVAATTGSARSLGIGDHVGRLRSGLLADLVAWDATHEGAFAHRLGSVRPRSVWKSGVAVVDPPSSFILGP